MTTPQVTNPLTIEDFFLQHEDWATKTGDFRTPWISRAFTSLAKIFGLSCEVKSWEDAAPILEILLFEPHRIENPNEVLQRLQAIVRLESGSAQTCSVAKPAPSPQGLPNLFRSSTQGSREEALSVTWTQGSTPNESDMRIEKSSPADKADSFDSSTTVANPQEPNTHNVEVEKSSPADKADSFDSSTNTPTPSGSTTVVNPLPQGAQENALKLSTSSSLEEIHLFGARPRNTSNHTATQPTKRTNRVVLSSDSEDETSPTKKPRTDSKVGPPKPKPNQRPASDPVKPTQQRQHGNPINDPKCLSEIGGYSYPAPDTPSKVPLRFQEEVLSRISALRSAINSAKHVPGVNLALDTGLGKTVTCVSHLKREREKHPDSDPALVVCPKALVPQWLNTIATTWPQAINKSKIGLLEAGPHSNNLAPEDLGKLWLVVTNHDPITTHFGSVVKESLRTQFAKHPFSLWITVGLKRNKSLTLEKLKSIRGACDAQLYKAQSGLGLFYSQAWSTLIVDEYHKVAGNPNTLSFMGLAMLPRDYTILVSATPLTNGKPSETFSIFKQMGFKQCESVSSWSTGFRPWEEAFLHPYSLDKYWISVSKSDPKVLEEIFIPLVAEYPRSVRLCRLATRLYCSIFNLIYSEFVMLKEATWSDDEAASHRANILVLYSLLQQVLIAPRVISRRILFSESDEDTPNELGKGLTYIAKAFQENEEKQGTWDETLNYLFDSGTTAFDEAPKFREILKILEEERGRLGSSGQNPKTLVFCQHTTVLRVFKEFLDKHSPGDLGVYFLHGTLTPAQRREVLRKFKGHQGQAILLLTLSLGGQGLDLQEANSVVFLHQLYNNAMATQAINRAARLSLRQDSGVQPPSVRVYRLAGMLDESNTMTEEIVNVDPHFEDLCSRKQDVIDSVQSQLSIKDIGSLLKLNVE